MWLILIAGVAFGAFVLGEIALSAKKDTQQEWQVGDPVTAPRETTDPQAQLNNALKEEAARSRPGGLGPPHPGATGIAPPSLTSTKLPSDFGNAGNGKMNVGLAPPKDGTLKGSEKSETVWTGAWRWQSIASITGVKIAVIPVQITEACKIGNPVSRVLPNRTLMTGSQYPSREGYWLEWDDAKCSQVRDIVKKERSGLM